MNFYQEILEDLQENGAKTIVAFESSDNDEELSPEKREIYEIAKSVFELNADIVKRKLERCAIGTGEYPGTEIDGLMTLASIVLETIT